MPGISVQSVAGRGHYVFIMPCDKPPFDNNGLRMALKLAINRTEPVEKILGGYGTVGHDGSPLILQVAEGAFPGAIEAAQLFQKSANAAGIPLEIKREPDWGGLVKENSTGLVYGIPAALVPAICIAVLAISVNLVADWVLARTSGLKGGRGG